MSLLCLFSPPFAVFHFPSQLQDLNRHPSSHFDLILQPLDSSRTALVYLQSGLCCCLLTPGTGSIVRPRVHLLPYLKAVGDGGLGPPNHVLEIRCVFTTFQVAEKCSKSSRSWFFSCCRSGKIISFVELAWVEYLISSL